MEDDRDYNNYKPFRTYPPEKRDGAKVGLVWNVSIDRSVFIGPEFRVH